MSQHDYDIANGSGVVVRADINSMASATATNNSGGTAPGTTFPHQFFMDESANLLRIRNAANIAWITLGSKVGDVWIPYINGVPVEQNTRLVGEGRLWYTNTPPAGWYICNGQALSRGVHSALFGIIGTAYGAGDGSTTFNLPDFRGRFPVGAGQGNTAEGGALGTLRSLGDLFGAEKHTQTEAEGFPHTHGRDSQSWGGGGGSGVGRNGSGANQGQSKGGGQAMPIIGPGGVVNFIVYSGA